MDNINEELGVGELNATVEEIDTKNETSKELKRRRGPTIMFDVTRIRSLGDKKVVRYNEDGAPIGGNEAKLKSFIGSVAFVIGPRSRKKVLQIVGILFVSCKALSFGGGRGRLFVSCKALSFRGHCLFLVRLCQFFLGGGGLFVSCKALSLDGLFQILYSLWSCIKSCKFALFVSVDALATIVV
ncbi:hypothetical protein IC575_014379 [Cucumis melo]